MSICAIYTSNTLYKHKRLNVRYSTECNKSTNDAFAGGTYAPASNLVNAGGTFGGPGYVDAAQRGDTQHPVRAQQLQSNVRIPYARLVPMRGMGDMQGGDPANPTGIRWGAVPDIKAHGGNNPLIGRPLGQEYDGLETGELAWIMGRKFLGTSLGEATHLENGTTPFRAISSSAHMLGMGFGVDRMQRLAYTSWMEAYFRALFGSQKVSCKPLTCLPRGTPHVERTQDIRTVLVRCDCSELRRPAARRQRHLQQDYAQVRDRLTRARRRAKPTPPWMLTRSAAPKNKTVLRVACLWSTRAPFCAARLSATMPWR